MNGIILSGVIDAVIEKTRLTDCSKKILIFPSGRIAGIMERKLQAVGCKRIQILHDIGVQEGDYASLIQVLQKQNWSDTIFVTATLDFRIHREILELCEQTEGLCFKEQMVDFYPYFLEENRDGQVRDRIVRENIKRGLLERMEELKAAGVEELLIYPYGKIGKMVELVIKEETDFRVQGVIDHQKADYQRIFDLDYLDTVDWSKTRVVLSVILKKIHKELKENLVKRGLEDYVIDGFDFFAEERLFDEMFFGEPRTQMLECCAREIEDNGIMGNCAEAGVFRGEFSSCINQCFPDRKLYLFDTFEGFDERDVVIERTKGIGEGKQDFSGTSIPEVLDKMICPDMCEIRKGFFPETAEGLEDTFCFVSLDMDLYQPTMAGLEYFYPRLAKGGYIFVHDCRNREYVGARMAVKEFTRKQGIGYVCLCDEQGTAVITK